MRGVYYSTCSLYYKTIARFHQKCLLMRDCLLFRRLLLPESTVHNYVLRWSGFFLSDVSLALWNKASGAVWNRARLVAEWKLTDPQSTFLAQGKVDSDTGHEPLVHCPMSLRLPVTLIDPTFNLGWKVTTQGNHKWGFEYLCKFNYWEFLRFRLKFEFYFSHSNSS